MGTLTKNELRKKVEQFVFLPFVDILFESYGQQK